MKNYSNKILEISSNYSPYNLEETIEIINSLVEGEEKQISVFSKDTRLNNYGKNKGKRNFNYYELIENKNKYVFALKFYKKLKRIIKENNAKIVKIDYNLLNFLNLLALKNKKYYLIIDLSNVQKIKNKFNIIDKLFFSRADKIIVPSLSASLYLEKFNVTKEKITYINKAVNNQVFSPENLPEARLAQFGRKIKLNNFDNFIFSVVEILYLEEYFLLLESLKKLELENITCVFLLEDKLNLFADKICEKARELNLNMDTIFLSEASDICALYKLSDLIIFPFTKERISSDKINEVRAAGKPVLVTESSFSKELIENKKTGFLCLAESDELAKEIKSIISLDEEIKQKIQNQSTNFVYDHFSIRQKTKKIIELYDNI